MQMEDTNGSGPLELHDIDVAILGLGSAGEQTAKLLAAAGLDAVRLADGTIFPAERVLVAAGVSPRLDSSGLESIDLTPTPLEIERDGSVAGRTWLWAAGDVTPYSHWTHGASIQARALASRLTGEAWAEPCSCRRTVCRDHSRRLDIRPQS